MEIYIARNDEPCGPYSVAELNQMLESETITGEDLCWYEGCDEWIYLSQFPGFVPPPSTDG